MSKASAQQQVIVPLFPYHSEEARPAGTTKRGAQRREGDSYKSLALQALCLKLNVIYGYKKHEIVPWEALPTSLRRKINECDYVIFNSATPLMILDCRVPKLDDARKYFISCLINLPDTLRYAIWTNGVEHLFLFREKKSWIEIPDLPRRGEPVGHVGKLYRSDLVTPDTLLLEFGDIRGHLAANAIGVTRDEIIAREVLKLLFCKIYDERHTQPSDYVQFCALAGEPVDQVKNRIETKLLRPLITANEFTYSTELGWTDTIGLDADSVAYAVGLLQHYEITKAGRDVIGQAFESLIGTALRGDEGQFFTPKNIVHMAVKMLNPKPGERVIDPACGSGGFLAAVSELLQQQYAGPDTNGRSPKNCKTLLSGIEKDNFLTAIAQAYMSIVGEGRAKIFCDDSLKPPDRWKEDAARECQLSTFDVLITNPPFGAKIPVKGEQTLRQYALARAWRKGKDHAFVMTDSLVPFRPPQILFVERCLEFLRDGGRMAIILPDGILGNVSDGYVRQFVSERAELIAVVDCPLETFLPSTTTKTSVVLLRKRSCGTKVAYPIFMAIAEKCGHDRRGKPIRRPDGTIDDDFPLIEAAFASWKQDNNVDF